MCSVLSVHVQVLMKNLLCYINCIIDRECVVNSQLLVVEDVEQIMDQAVTRQCLVHYAGKQSLPMLQLPPWGLQQGVTQTIDSCWSIHIQHCYRIEIAPNVRYPQNIHSHTEV